MQVKQIFLDLVTKILRKFGDKIDSMRFSMLSRISSIALM